MNNYNKKIILFNVSNDDAYFQNYIEKIVKDSMKILGKEIPFSKNDINIIDGYVGRGYALNVKEELEFIKDISRKEGLILDPVYTGKCFRGLYNEINNGKFNDSEKILFIHTGGLYGLFPKSEEFDF